jgi:hypothetical protein
VPTFLRLDGPFSETSQQTSAGTFLAFCESQPDYPAGGFGMDFTAAGATLLWRDDNGSVSLQSLASGQLVILYNVGTGTHHIVPRATNGSAAGAWDIFASSNGTDSCEVSVSQSVAALSPLG